jgi:hypothetical protein
MRAKLALLCGAAALILIWVLLLPNSGLTPLDQDDPSSDARTPVEVEVEEIGRAPIPEQDEAAQLHASEANPTDLGTRAGIWVKRSDGTPAAELRVTIGDAPLDREGEGARSFAWLVTNQQGFARVKNSDLERFSLLRRDGRALYAAAFFPYPGPPQVIWPLPEEQLLAGQQVLHLRPAGQIEVSMVDAAGEAHTGLHDLKLSQGPESNKLTLAFGGAGRYGDVQLAEGPAIRFPWVGVGLAGIIESGTSAVRFRGPMFERDTEPLQLQVPDSTESSVRLKFKLVDAAGRPIPPLTDLRWQIDVIRDGVVWHTRTGAVEQDGNGADHEIHVLDLPAALANDELSLRLHAEEQRWRPRDISACSAPGEYDLGLFALEPLPLLVAGEIPGLFELGVSEIRFQVQESLGVDLSGEEQWRAIRVVQEENLRGTDAHARFRIHGEPSSARMRLMVLAGVWFEPVYLDFHTGAEDLRVELKRRRR